MAEHNVARTPALVLLLVVFLYGVAAWFCYPPGVEKQAVTDANEARKQVAEYAVSEYRLLYRHGAAWDRCAQAGVVVAAYSQARDGRNYEAWRRIEATDCRLAGILR